MNSFEINKIIASILLVVLLVFSVNKLGDIVFKVEKSIPPNKRGLLLLGLEDQLKNNIDKGLTVWFEPVGDKSKLRNLRGIKVKEL